MAANEKPRSKSLAQLQTAGDLEEKRLELNRLRNADTRDWALNRAFYRGDQWSIWNRNRGQVQSLPVSDEDKPRWKVRLVSNQVTPGVEHYVAQMTKTRPVIRALPDSGSFTDRKAAEVGEALYDNWWRELSLGAKLQTSLTDAQLSEGYWLIDWDGLAGKSITFLLGPDGKPIQDQTLGDAYRDQLMKQAEEMGVDPKILLQQVERTVQVGEIRVLPIPGERAWVDPSATVWEEAKYCIVRHDLDVDDIAARWGKRLEPDTSPQEGGEVPLLNRTLRDERPKTMRSVFCLYVRPHAAMPQGRYAVWSGTEKLADSSWNLPFDELPLIQFPGIERPGTLGQTPRTSLTRPLQKEMNRTLSQLVQHKDLAIKPQLLTPIGATRTKLTDEPGAAIEYQPVQGLKPEWRDIPNLPAHAYNILDRIQADIDRLYNRMPSQRDQIPSRADSGQLLELMQEAIADQMTPEIRRLEDALARAGRLMVLLAKEYYIEPRLLKITGPGGATRSKKFFSADLRGGFSFHPVMDTGLPRSRTGQVQTIKDMLELQLLDKRTAIKHLPLADVRGLQDKLALDEDQAYREHEKLINGVPLNPFAVRQAMAAVQAGVDPNTQQPITDPQQAQMILMQAAVAPLDYEDSDTHLEVHDDYMKSVEFEHLPEDAQQRFVMHRQATQQRLISLQQAAMAMDPKALPGLSVAAKSTVSAPVMAQILAKHGINVTEDEITEPPLETAVYDSVDKADTDEAGNDVLTAQELAVNEQQHELDMAKATQSLAATQAKHQMDMTHQQQKHELAMQQAQAQHEQNAAKEQQAQVHRDQAHQEQVRAMKHQAAQQRVAQKKKGKNSGR